MDRRAQQTPQQIASIRAFMLGGIWAAMRKEMLRFMADSVTQPNRLELMENDRGEPYGFRVRLASGLVFEIEATEVTEMVADERSNG